MGGHGRPAPREGFLSSVARAPYNFDVASAILFDQSGQIGEKRMVLFNHATREMTAKIVYYGPGLCGKTTNLMVIFDKLDEHNRGKMLSLATKTDRTLFFDLLPVDIGKIGAFNLKIQLYTVPGQVFYNETRKLVLKGADAVVFVVDSQPSMVESNRESFKNLLENLEENSIDPNEIPIVIQYNKRDIPGVTPVEDLETQLGFEGYPAFEASAVQGEGVMETFKLATKITAKHLIGKLQGKSTSRPGRVEKKKSKKASAFVPTPEPEPAFATDDNPFASSLPDDSIPPSADAPFEDPSTGYEGVEEVSLEQLLEGRERPATMAGNTRVPFPAEDEPPAAAEPVSASEDEIEHLDAGLLIPEEARSQPTPIESPSAEIAELRAEIGQLRQEIAQLKEALRNGVAELGKLIR
jgi:signal recognition particle receptor subunit beta